MPPCRALPAVGRLSLSVPLPTSSQPAPRPFSTTRARRDDNGPNKPPSPVPPPRKPDASSFSRRPSFPRTAAPPRNALNVGSVTPPSDLGSMPHGKFSRAEEYSQIGVRSLRPPSTRQGPPRQSNNDPRRGGTVLSRLQVVDKLYAERSGPGHIASHLGRQREEQSVLQRERARIAQNAGRQAAEQQKTLSEQQDRADSLELLSMQPLRFKHGDTYAPHDLTPGEQRHYMSRGSIGKPRPVRRDDIEESGINPLDCYRNFTLIRHWTTDTSRILHGDQTGYSPRNQRKVAKAVRRAIGLGLYPSTHAHPEHLFRSLTPIDELRVAATVQRTNEEARRRRAAESAERKRQPGVLQL